MVRRTTIHRVAPGAPGRCPPSTRTGRRPDPIIRVIELVEIELLTDSCSRARRPPASHLIFWRDACLEKFLLIGGIHTQEHVLGILVHTAQPANPQINRSLRKCRTSASVRADVEMPLNVDSTFGYEHPDLGRPRYFQTTFAPR